VGHVRSVNSHNPDLLSSTVEVNGRGPESDHFLMISLHIEKYASLCLALRNSAFLTIVEWNAPGQNLLGF
jgi:hypothetical protein